MKINDWLEKAINSLNKAGVGTARLDVLVLLEDATGKDRSFLLAHPEFTMNKTLVSKLDEWLERRTKHEPLAYIRGKTEFYGRTFLVDKRVLEPRPESETMIDLLKTLKLSKTPHLIDVGAGSGALGITAVMEIAGSSAELIDVDNDCLSIARKNLELHKVTAQLIQSDLLDKVNQIPEVILANLPYVPDENTINEAAMHEPRIAIFGGLDGLDVYRKLFLQVEDLPQKPKYILTESLPFQHSELIKIAKQTNYKLRETNDFIQVFEI